jgi:hypothetical protein
MGAMKRLLTPLNVGVGATRHLIWYLSYQVTGEARDTGGDAHQRLASPPGRT